MNKKVKFILITIGIILLIIVANIAMKNLPISKVEVEMIYKGSDKLIVKEQVYSLLNKKYGAFTNYKIKEIDTKEIEEFLESKNFIYAADVYLNLLGGIEITITQNNPIFRIINNKGEQRYIDEQGNICNMLKEKSANVPIANGEIKETLKGLQKIDSIQTPITYNLYMLVTKLREDTLLYNQIDQIYYNKNTTYDLIPKIGDYIIRFGKYENVDNKLLKLNNLYKEGFLEFGWDNYSEVKLEFEGQVVCVRK